MPLCIVKKCTNRTGVPPVLGPKTERNVSNTSYHRFSRNEKLKYLWLSALHLSAESVPIGARVCSAHFSEDAFYFVTGTKRLRPNACPLIEHEIEDVPKEAIIASCSTSISSKVDRATSPIAGCSHFADQSLEQKHFETKLEDTKNFFTRKIKVLQQRLRRKESRIVSMKAILDSLRKNNMLQTEELQILEDIGGPNSKLIERQLQKNRGESVNKQFNNQWKSFALTLHYYSPRAYEYVREEFNNCLPHCKTISKWYQSIEGKPGIMLEAVNAVKQRANGLDYKLLGSLVFDEMAIRQHVEQACSTVAPESHTVSTKRRIGRVQKLADSTVSTDAGFTEK